jgi:hypothetical protein
LYDVGPNDLCGDNWEIIVVLEGMVEATGGTTQARASYLPEEIFWGRRFKNVVTRGQRDKGYLINFKHFHELYESNNPPKCSAKEMDESGGGDETNPVFSIGHSVEQSEEKLEGYTTEVSSNSEAPSPTTVHRHQ